MQENGSRTPILGGDRVYTSEHPRPVILDCDPGHDDAIAMILAAASPELRILGITTVAGNQTIEKTTRNALRMATFLGLSVPVGRGASRPLCRPLIIAPEVHGASGLDGPDLPEPAYREVSLPAAELLAALIMNQPEEEPVTLICTGALTNIALLLNLHPEAAGRIERISIMGGGVSGGNWTPAAEFNILVDPEAADRVFRSGIPMTMAGLDVTHKAIVSRSDAERIRAVATPQALLTAELLDFFIRFHEERFPWFGGSPLHDVCAVMVLLRPELFSKVDCAITIDITGELTTGCTVADLRSFGYHDPKTPRIEALMDLNTEEFLNELIGRLARPLRTLERESHTRDRGEG